MKFVDIFRTASSNMLRSKLRSFLTIIAIFIGALTLTLTNGIGSGIAAYIDEQLGNIGAEDMLIIQAKADDPFGGEGPQKYESDRTTTNAGGFPMPMLSQNDLDKIKATDGIKSASFDLNVAPDYIAGKNGEKYKFTAGSFYDGINITLMAGQTPDNQSNQNQILLSPDFPAPLGFGSAQEAVGQEAVIGIKTPAGQQREVAAVISGVQEKTLMSQGGLQLNRALLEELYNVQTEGLPAAAKETQPVVTARFDATQSDEAIQKIKDDLDRQGYTATTIEDQIGIFKQVIDAIIMVLNFFAAIALLAASFGIVNTLLMAVQERTKEIGLMKAMGMSRRKVFLLFSVEAVLLGFWGSLLGSLVGIGIGRIANKVAANTFLKDLVGFELTSFPFGSVLVIMLIIMTIAFLAGALPANRASKKDPIEALRYE